MKTHSSPLVIHPILIALFPILGLASSNVNELVLPSVYRAIFVSMILATGIWVLAWLLIRDLPRSAMIASLSLLLFFSYGHLYNLVKNFSIEGWIIGRHRFLLVMFLTLFAIGGYLIHAKLIETKTATQILNLISVALILFPLITLIGYEFQPDVILEDRSDEQRSESYELQVGEGPLPDIYYIVLDGYGREDILAEIYGYPNHEFVDKLRQLGFYIAGESNSNYIQTALSLASSLNIGYLTDLVEQMGPESVNRKPLNQMIVKNEVRDLLESIGYQTIAFDTGLEATSMTDADFFWPSEGNPFYREDIPLSWWLNPFEGLLLETTMVRVLLDGIGPVRDVIGERVGDPNYELHRIRVEYTVENLSKAVRMPGDYFVFAHVVSPHPPFVFDSSGNPLNPPGAFTYFDGNEFLEYVAPRESYIRGYRDQLSYLNTLVLEEIEEIIARSDPAPIIILQGDHGPGAYLDWSSLEGSYIIERTAILNAYYFPGEEYSSLYPSISPINSFRVLFNTFFNSEYEILEDLSYFAPPNRPYKQTLIGTN